MEKIFTLSQIAEKNRGFITDIKERETKYSPIEKTKIRKIMTLKFFDVVKAL